MSPCLHTASGVHVCGGRRNAIKTARRFFKCRSRRAACPTVRKRLHEGWLEEWYGWTFKCLACGFANILDGERAR